MLSTAMMIALALATAPAAKPETRCGWIANPTPANWWLTDRDGEWVIGEQGGYQASGADLPDFTARRGQWVVTNAGDHGYGCACLTATYDRKAMRVLNIASARARPLAQCKADRALRGVRP